MLVNDLLQKSIHTLTNDRIIEPLAPKKRTADAQPISDTMSEEPEGSSQDKFSIPGSQKSGVMDVFIVRAAALQGGKFNEFLEDTIIDPSLGYPLTDADMNEAHSEVSRGVLEDADIEGDDDKPVCPGFGGLGGGGEYA